METKTIVNRFRLCYILTLIISAVITKCFYFSQAIFISDIYFTGSKNLLIRNLPKICNCLSIVTKALFIGAAIAFIIYAIRYFSRRAAIRILVYTLICFTVGEIVGLIYNLIWNKPSVHYLLAGLFAFLSDIMFFLLILISALIVSNLFLKFSFESRRRDRLKRYNEYTACLFPPLIYLLINILDLTCFNVIPFFVQYDNIMPSEIKSILLDYLYYILIAFLLPYIFSLFFTFINKKLTGQLIPKYNGGTKIK